MKRFGTPVERRPNASSLDNLRGSTESG